MNRAFLLYKSSRFCRSELGPKSLCSNKLHLSFMCSSVLYILVHTTRLSFPIKYIFMCPRYAEFSECASISQLCFLCSWLIIVFWLKKGQISNSLTILLKEWGMLCKPWVLCPKLSYNLTGWSKFVFSPPCLKYAHNSWMEALFSKLHK
jgi:hypothetical protein